MIELLKISLPKPELKHGICWHGYKTKNLCQQSILNNGVQNKSRKQTSCCLLKSWAKNKIKTINITFKLDYQAFVKLNDQTYSLWWMLCNKVKISSLMFSSCFFAPILREQVCFLLHSQHYTVRERLLD